MLANTTCTAPLGGLPKRGKPEPRASPNNETNNALQANVKHGEPDESSARQPKDLTSQIMQEATREDRILPFLFPLVSYPKSF